MIDIARHAGVGKGTLYEHFEGKEDLFTTLVLAVMREALEALAAGTLADEPERALARTIDYLVATALEENLDLYRLFFDFWGVSAAYRKKSRDPLRECAAAFRDLVAEILRKGQRAGRFRADLDPDAFARALLASVEGLSLPMVILGEAVDLPAHAATLRALFLGAAVTGAPLYGASLLREKR